MPTDFIIWPIGKQPGEQEYEYPTKENVMNISFLWFVIMFQVASACCGQNTPPTFLYRRNI